MKEFGHIKEAIKEVRRMAKEGDYSHEIFLFYDNDNPEYFVTDDETEIGEHIEGCYGYSDVPPEDEADSWNVWLYDVLEDGSLTRKEKTVESEHSISFFLSNKWF